MPTDIDELPVDELMTNFNGEKMLELYPLMELLYLAVLSKYLLPQIVTLFPLNTASNGAANLATCNTNHRKASLSSALASSHFDLVLLTLPVVVNRDEPFE